MPFDLLVTPASFLYYPVVGAVAQVGHAETVSGLIESHLYRLELDILAKNREKHLKT